MLQNSIDKYVFNFKVNSELQIKYYFIYFYKIKNYIGYDKVFSLLIR